MIKQKRGVALIWVMVLGTILVLVSTTMTDVIIKESRMSVDINQSTIVLSAAQAGIEWGKECLDNGGCAYDPDVNPSAGTKNLTIDTNSRAEVTITDGPDEKVITSTGITSTNVRRRIEYKWSKEDPNVIAGYRRMRDIDGDGDLELDVDDGTNLSKPLTIDGNFTMSFFYWGVPTNDTRFGLGTDSPTQPRNLHLQFFNSGTNKVVELVGFDTNGTRIDQDAIITLPDSFQIDRTNALKFKLEYIRGLAAKLSVQTKVSGFDCQQSVTLDLTATGVDLPTMTRFYSYSTVSPTALDFDNSDPDNPKYRLGTSYIDTVDVKGITLN